MVSLKPNGFQITLPDWWPPTFNESKNWYERTWSTNQGADTILEVYQKVDDKWKQLMIGYGGVTFYETDLKDLDELL